MKQCSRNMQIALVGMFLVVSSGSFSMDAPSVMDAEADEQFDAYVKNSKSFARTGTLIPIIKTNTMEALGEASPENRKQIVKDAQSATTLAHPIVLGAFQCFLKDKLQKGTSAEQNLYKDMIVPDFVGRLVTARYPVFYKNANNRYEITTKTGGQFTASINDILAIKNDNAQALEERVTNEEMELGALVTIVSSTLFINSGDRFNKGVPNHNKEAYEKQGFYAGLVGPCFETEKWLEYKYMVVTKEQNTADRGYGFDACNEGMLAIHSLCYGLKFPTYEQAIEDKTGRFIPIKGDKLFDTFVYAESIRLRVEPFLKAAHLQAQKEDKKAYVHAIGIGLGVWEIDQRQGEWMIDAYIKMIEENDLSSISDINFSWFEKEGNPYKDSFEKAKTRIIEAGKLRNIKIHFSKRNPAAELVGEDEGKLLYAMFAGDSIAMSGNECRRSEKTLDNSGEAAAGCCSIIPELHNGDINPNLARNTKSHMAKLMQDNDIEKIILGQRKKLKNGKIKTSWSRSTWVLIGATSVTLVAALYYFFHDKIPAHWPALSKFSFIK